VESEVNLSAETATPVTMPPEPVIPWGWVRALLAVPVWVLVQIIVMIPTMQLLGIGWETSQGDLIVRPVGLVVQLGQLVSTLLTVWVMRRWIDRASFVSLGLSLNRAYVRDLIAGVFCGIALISAIFLVVLGGGGLSVVSVQLPSLSFVMLTIAMILVAINEELYVRGYLLTNLMASTNKYVALLLSSLIFSLFHLFNPNSSTVGLVNIVLAGLLLGVYYIHKRNLWFPIGLHFSWNLFQGGVYGSEVSGVKIASVITITTTGDPLLTGGSFGFEASLVTTVLLSAAILVVHLIYRPRTAPAAQSV
jgi:membrane protease YdiL (CAAX protease family)